jgi:hypothetical protein
VTARREWVVALYETNRAYGGPEEGGWWYDVGKILDRARARRFGPDQEQEARAYLAELSAHAAQVNREEGRREPGSVLCDGWLAARMIRRWPWQSIPRGWPRRKPVYQ